MQRATLSAMIAVVLGVGFVLLRGEGLDMVSVGVLGGITLGSAAALLSHSLVSAAMQLQSEKALQFVLAGFGVKAVGAIGPWAVLAFWAPAAGVADPASYVLGYISAVLLVLGAGVFDHLRLAAVVSHQRARAGKEGGLTHPVPTGSSAPLESAS
ncbi:hypothetical protein N9Z54_05455 [Planctomycetota bacterium]|nr:hypothetical protein [Planctomycetota bacterium]MDB4401495.1 hypothetical protein [bacterium]